MFMVHAVHNDAMAARKAPPASSMSVHAFAASVQALLDDYSVVSLDQAVGMLSGCIPWRSRCVVLTFDDSLKSLVYSAAAWLSSAGLTATFFISTDAIDSQCPYWWKRLEYAVDHAATPRATVAVPGGRQFEIEAGSGYYSLGALKAELKTLPGPAADSVVAEIERQLGVALANDHNPYTQIMSWDDVRELHRLGMSVGSHSLSHPNLSLSNPADLRRELVLSRETIERKAGIPCHHFCYPYGGYSPAACSMAGEAGYRSAVTTIAPGWNARGADLFRLRRFGLPSAQNRSRFVLSGIPELARRKSSRIPSAFAGYGLSLSA